MVTINSRCLDFIFEISAIAFLEYAVNLIKLAPGARSKTLRSLTEHASTPGIELHAFLTFFESDKTNSTLLPVFFVLPRKATFPERFFLFSNLCTS